MTIPLALILAGILVLLVLGLGLYATSLKAEREQAPDAPQADVDQ